MRKLWNLCISVVFFLAVALTPGVSSAEKTIGIILTGVIPYYEDIQSNFERELKGTGAGKLFSETKRFVV
jgi:hypothetical protein